MATTEDPVVHHHPASTDAQDAEFQNHGHDDLELEDLDRRSVVTSQHAGTPRTLLQDVGQQGNQPQTTAATQNVASQPNGEQLRESSTNIMPFKNKKKQKGQKEWRSYKIKSWWITSLIILEAGMIAAIIYLERRSATQNGITSVSQYTTFSITGLGISFSWKYGLLWTSLPSLVMTLYRLMWDTVVSGTSDRQPFVELKRSASAKKTIMLDYRSYPSFFTPYKAFENGHILLAISMILSLIMTIAVVPLTAHLFVALASQTESPISLNFRAAYNDSALTGKTSLQPAIDLAAANTAYRGKPPPWMTLEYAFEPFDTNGIKRTGNITTVVSAYSAALDCHVFSETDSSATYSPLDDGGDGSVNYHFKDRDCEISGFVTLSNETLTYARSWQSNCPGSQIGRIGMFAGFYAPTSDIKIANYSLASCIPTYWNITGSLTVAVQPDSDPEFISFTPTSNSSFRAFLYTTLEQNLHSYTFFDASGSFWADAFGLAIYNFAQAQNPLSPITPDLIKTSTEGMFQTLYAGLATRILIQVGNTPETADGIFSSPVTRLYVVTPVAYTIVGVLSLILLSTIGLFIYAQMRESVLLEEPIGLIGSAALLDGSDVPGFVSEFRRKHAGENDMRAFLKENYTVKSSKCFMEKGSRKIRVFGLQERAFK